jgi:hypothetical protein
MSAVLRLPGGLYERLHAHLLPHDPRVEQAAFLFAAASNKHDTLTLTLDVLDHVLLEAPDFETQLPDYLELKDSTRSNLITRAHKLGAALVELHSHLSPWPAEFSLADTDGLKETVPSVWWRLPQRPYLAMVVARSGFDALLWRDNPVTPQELEAMMAGDQMLRPTQHSIRRWT